MCDGSAAASLGSCRIGTTLRKSVPASDSATTERGVLMHGAKRDLAVSFQGDGVDIRDVEWGNINVSLESFPAGMDTAPIFKGLPDDRCQCPHWGYLIQGRMRVLYKDHEEVVESGEAYYLAPGHTTVFEAPTEVVEFSPAGEYQKTMEVAARNVAAMQAAGAAAD
jgi:hypothetical protein